MNLTGALWLIWCIMFFIFAYFIVSHLGAFDSIRSRAIVSESPQIQNSNLNQSQHLIDNGAPDTIVYYNYDGTEIRINASQRQRLVCALRFGLWC